MFGTGFQRGLTAYPSMSRRICCSIGASLTMAVDPRHLFRERSVVRHPEQLWARVVPLRSPSLLGLFLAARGVLPLGRLDRALICLTPRLVRLATSAIRSWSSITSRSASEHEPDEGLHHVDGRRAAIRADRPRRRT